MTLFLLWRGVPSRTNLCDTACTTNFSEVSIGQLSGGTKVNQNQLPSRADHYICRFNITMEIVLLMDEMQNLRQLF